MFILLCSLVSAGTVVLSEGDVKDGLEVIKIYEDKVFVKIDGGEAFLRVDKPIRGVTLLSVNKNSVDASYTKAVFDISTVVEEPEEEREVETLSLGKGSGVRLGGKFIVFVKATDNVAMFSIDGVEKLVRKSEKFAVGDVEVQLITLSHNVMDESFDSVGLRVAGSSSKVSGLTNKITGNVIGSKAVDYASKGFNSVQKVPIKGAVVDKSKDLGQGVLDDAMGMSMPWWKRFVSWLMGK